MSKNKEVINEKEVVTTESTEDIEVDVESTELVNVEEDIEGLNVEEEDQ